MAQVVRTLALQGVADEQRGTVELVLAEVMNNISKHAYAGACGRIELDIARDGDDLSFSVVDDGRPMPCGVLPRGCAAELDCAVEDLPEGGFGWRLIRELTRDLVYLRIGERNHLAFRIPARA
ncbi:ATP-binding protein [Rhodobacteraceae bacterium MCCB 386]|nr:ATP-binding protein [Roseitranquillus sediminis]